MKQFALVPFDTQSLKNKIFDSPYGIFKDLLSQQGVKLDTYDMVSLSKVDKVLFFNFDEALYGKCIEADLKKENLVLFAFEPRTVIPEQYRPETWQRFGKVFTFLDDKIDDKSIFKARYPQAQDLKLTKPGFGKRKFLTLINGNKYSYVPNELYSRRREAIRYFEKRPDFDLFGFGWEKGNKNIGKKGIVEALKYSRLVRLIKDVADSSAYEAYRGSIDNKYKTLGQYKFCLCFENEEKVLGYITEKIFDCLVCGTVPIYLGAENITDYVPEECFIDMRGYKNFSELERRLDSITESEFTSYQKAATKFLNSDRFKYWLPEKVFGDFVRDLLR